MCASSASTAPVVKQAGTRPNAMEAEFHISKNGPRHHWWEVPDHRGIQGHLHRVPARLTEFLVCLPESRCSCHNLVFPLWRRLHLQFCSMVQFPPKQTLPASSRIASYQIFREVFKLSLGLLAAFKPATCLSVNAISSTGARYISSFPLLLKNVTRIRQCNVCLHSKS